MKDNPENISASQREAICHGCGPALILAGPGSGKTFVITKRLQYLIETRHIPPEKIGVITFTKAAALQMQQRFISLTGKRYPVRFGTFHAFYYHILQEYQKENSLILLTEKEKSRYMRQVLQKLHKDEGMSDVFLEQIGRIKNGKKPLCLQEEIGCIFDAYRELCRESGKLDFDDMAYECLRLFQTHKEVLALWQGRLRYLLVDEYQDIAPIQEKLLFLLAMPENNLFLVGDDDQSIYGFRGAGPESMLAFPRLYPETKQIILEKNYRSRPEIVRAAQAVIAENKVRYFKKQLPVREKTREPSVICIGSIDGEQEQELIAARLLELQRAGKLGSAAVLYRRHGDAQPLLAALQKKGILYVQDGRKQNLYEHFIMEDVTAYLRFLYGDRTRKNFYRIMNRPDRGIAREGCSGECISFQELRQYYQGKEQILKELGALETACRRAEKMNLFAAVMYIRKAMGYEEYVKAGTNREKEEENLALLQQIQALSRQASDIRSWLELIEKGKDRSRRKREINTDGEENSVHIMTYHSAKGLEFEQVFLPGLNEGRMPYKKAVTEMEIEEERRLFYVGMTRAREKLYLYYHKGTKEEPETMSRFLKPLINHHPQQAHQIPEYPDTHQRHLQQPRTHHHPR